MFQLQFAPVLARWPDLLAGGWLTIWLSAVSIALGTAVGLGVAWVQTMGPRALRWGAGIYVELIRNTPFLVQLYLIFFGLPAAGVQLSAVQAGILAMTVNLGAYSAEIFRAGLDSVHRSQAEAGLALALTRLQIFFYVMLKPAVERVWPSLVSQLILITLTSSVCSFISVEELSGTAYTIQSDTFRSLEVYIIVGLLYLVLTLLLKIAFAVLGGWLFGRARIVKATLQKPIGSLP